MVIDEIIETVETIPDPYLRATTYAKIAERLAKINDKRFKFVFIKAIETSKNIEDPVKVMKALLSIGYSMAKSGLKTSKKVYQRVVEDSKSLPAPIRDELMALAARYMLGLGEINEAIYYASEIKSEGLRDAVLLQIIRRNTALIGSEKVKVAYRIRKSKMALEMIHSEPFRSKALIEIMKSYFLMGSYENGINVIKEIGLREWAKYAFKEALFFLKEYGVLERYVIPLKELSKELVEKFGEDFKIELAIAFALTGEPFEAADLIRKLDGKELLVEASLRLLDVSPKHLADFIRTLNDREAAVVGKAVMNRFLEKPEDGDWEVVRAIWERTGNEEVMVKMVRYSLLRGDVEGAMRVAERIRSERLRSIALADIAHSLLKLGNVSRAIDVALEVRDRRFSSILMAEILLSAADTEIEKKVIANGTAKGLNGKKA
ncbi:prenyltransferase [Thermococcus gorgonarius]|uniref:Prenyltransferase n=1 Tax=Thermococcus gorgonarius TaxID=71997 RepID=A0A2Z2M5V9_THEGO|nr:prenyltransferase [Thermococcus gorgonarius]ASJ00563.1 prenyltransferase [Thermococcus gorgonarius]